MDFLFQHVSTFSTSFMHFLFVINDLIYSRNMWCKMLEDVEHMLQASA